jgi:hypothetical protein
MTKVIVVFRRLTDMDGPVHSLKNASAALVLIHADMDNTTLAGKAMEFMVNKIGEDANRLAEIYESLGERPVSDQPEEASS